MYGGAVRALRGRSMTVGNTHKPQGLQAGIVYSARSTPPGRCGSIIPLCLD
jgi:hypothetical protein